MTFSEGEAGGTEAMRFPVRAEAATMARTAIQDMLTSVPRSVLFDAQLLTSELVSNAVRHAGLGPEDAVGLTIALTPDRLHVGVLDDGPGFEAAAHRPDAVGGWVCSWSRPYRTAGASSGASGPTRGGSRSTSS